LEHEWSTDFISIEVPSELRKLKVVMTPPPFFINGTPYIYPLV